jgi:hypothetical protein
MCPTKEVEDIEVTPEMIEARRAAMLHGFTVATIQRIGEWLLSIGRWRHRAVRVVTAPEVRSLPRAGRESP